MNQLLIHLILHIRCELSNFFYYLVWKWLGVAPVFRLFVAILLDLLQLLLLISREKIIRV